MGSSIIKVKRDPTIKLPKLKAELQSTCEKETGQEQEWSPRDVQQTKVFGILMPIIALNGIIVDWGELDYFSLDATGHVPKIEFSFVDRLNQFEKLDLPGTSNEVQIQILPQFDGAYKKIDMLFYVTQIDVNGGMVKGKAEYKNKELIKTQFKSFGELSTYKLIDEISKETGLGLASNIEDTDDKRYIYCDHMDYEELMDREIEISGASETHVYDYWIDLWNYLVICDIFERYDSIDPVEKQPIWIADIAESAKFSDKIVPIQTARVFTNSPAHARSELYVNDYNSVNHTGLGYSQGTTRIVSVYDEDKKEYIDHLVKDGDVEEDNFIKYEYAGEVYGGYNYLFAEECRDMYMRKINSETIVITLNHPVLSIMRGEQIRFVWMENNQEDVYNRQQLEEAGIPKIEQLDMPGWMREWVMTCKDNKGIDPLQINLEVSGQYTVIGQYMSYDNQQWTYQMTLARPAKRKIRQLPKDSDTANVKKDI